VSRGIRVAVVSGVCVIAVASSVALLAKSEAPSGPPSDETSGTIEGVLELRGGPVGTIIPVAGSITVLPRGDEFVTDEASGLRTEAGADGAFSIKVPPGAYVVYARSDAYGGEQGVCRMLQRFIEVVQGGSVEVVVACEMK
jgi:type IV secretory pathway VirB2 component (pilin)